MPEPTSSGAVGVIGFIKLFLPGIATTIGTAVMYMLMLPRNQGEWFKRLVVTILCSTIFGPFVFFWFESTGVGSDIVHNAVNELGRWLDPASIKMAIAGPILAMSGLPGWYVLGWIIRFLENNKDKDAGEVLKEVGDISRKFEP